MLGGWKRRCQGQNEGVGAQMALLSPRHIRVEHSLCLELSGEVSVV